MKRILLFFGLLFLANILIGQTTQKDTVNVKPFEDLTLVTDGTVDTSDQFLIYDISAGLFSYRLSLGELLKKAIDVPNIVGSSQIVNGSILDTDISGSAGIGLNKLATTAAGRLLLTDSGGAGTWVSGTPGYGLTISGTSMLADTSSATGLVSKSRLTNALDDISGGGGNAASRALQTITADGTDTLNFGGTSYSTDYWQIDMGSVTSSTINFTNPNTSIVPTYNLHFTNASSDTITFASTLLDANLDTISSHVFEQGQIVPIYYYNSDYYTNYLNMSVSSGTPTVTFEAEYSNIISYAENNGFTTPNDATQTLQNTLIDSLKTIGVWDSIEWMYVFSHNTGLDSFSLINWKDTASFRATMSNITFSDTGSIASTASGFINTNFDFTQASVVTNNSASVIYMLSRNQYTVKNHWGLRDYSTIDSLWFAGFTFESGGVFQVRHGVLSTSSFSDNDVFGPSENYANKTIVSTYKNTYRRAFINGVQFGTTQIVSGGNIYNTFMDAPFYIQNFGTGVTPTGNALNDNKFRFFILANIHDPSNIQRVSSVLKTYTDSL